MAIGKLPGGVEDLTFGLGTEQQQRQFGIVAITQIHAGVIPYSETQSITQVVDPIKEGLDSHRLATSNPHNVTAHQVGAAPLEHTHELSDIDDINVELSKKVNVAGDTMTGRLEVRNTVDVHRLEVRVQADSNAITAYGTTAHIKFNTSDRDFSVSTPDGNDFKMWHAGNFDAPGHKHDDLYFEKDEYLDVSTGLADAGKPIILNAQGQVDSTMIDVNSFYYVGAFTPTGGDEYPDASGETSGAFWSIEGVDDILGYTFVAGDLAGQTVFNGDFLINGTAGWGILIGEINPTLYYKLDGTLALTDSFQAGGQQLKNIANGTDPQDGVSVAQMNAQFALAVAKAGDTMNGDLTIGDGVTGEKLNIVGADVSDKPEAMLYRNDGTLASSIHWDSATNSLVLVSYATNGADELSRLIIGDKVSMVNSVAIADPSDVTDKTYTDAGDATVQGNLDTHLGDVANPHAVTKLQVGLGNVDDTADANKPVSGPQQDALDLKVNKAGDTMTGDLNVQGAVEVTDEFVTGIYPATSNSVVIFTDTSGTPSGLPGLVWNNLDAEFQVDPGDGINYTMWNAHNFNPDEYTTVIDFSLHTNDNTNPHLVTKTQVGLGNADDTSDLNKPVSTATQTALDLKFEKTEHVVESAGAADAGKPVILDGSGVLHPTITGTGMYPVGLWTPTGGNEYPDTTGEAPGAYWAVDGVDPVLGYEFLTGDLIGITLNNGDAMIHGAQEWLYLKLNLNPDEYYRLDGTVAIAAPFAGGAQQLKNIADGTEATDALAVGQVAPLLDLYVAKAGDTMTGDLLMDNADVQFQEVGTGIVGFNGESMVHTETDSVVVGNNVDSLFLDAVANPTVRIGGVTQGGLWHEGNFTPADYLPVGGTAVNSHLLDNLTPLLLPLSTATINALAGKLDINATADNSLLLVGLTPAQQPISTATQTALDAKADGTDLSSHLADVANPHVVTKAQVGLGNADDTSDLAKPISTATQGALDAKADTTALTAHTGNTGNPHSVTAAQVGAPGGSWTWDGTTLAITIP